MIRDKEFARFKPDVAPRLLDIKAALTCTVPGSFKQSALLHRSYRLAVGALPTRRLREAHPNTGLSDTWQHAQLPFLPKPPVILPLS